MDSLDFGLQMVWTKASTSQGIFRPVSALIETASVGGARMSVDLRASTRDLALLPEFLARFTLASCFGRQKTTQAQIFITFGTTNFKQQKS